MDADNAAGQHDGGSGMDPVQPPRAPGQEQLRVRLEEGQQALQYINIFRSSTTSEEVMLDVGVSGMGMTTEGGKAAAELVLKLPTRLIMNFNTAKRLALALGKVVREHEAVFGTIELDANKRRSGSVRQG